MNTTALLCEAATRQGGTHSAGFPCYAPVCRRAECTEQARMCGAICRSHQEALIATWAAQADEQGEGDGLVEVIEERVDKLGRTRRVKRIELEGESEAFTFVRDYRGSFGFILDLQSRIGVGAKAGRIRWTPKMIAAVLRVKEQDASRAKAAATDPRHIEALEYVASYTGTFGLILDIKARNIQNLSPRQVEVILASKARDEARRPAPGAAAPAPAAGEGWYELDGTIYKVQKAVHGSGNLYAKALTVEDGSGTWTYAPGMVRRLTEAHRLSAERAAELGKLYGVCMICGRTLTDEGSIERGIGPICLGKIS